MIASAVILPDPEDVAIHAPALSSPSLKRRQSSLSPDPSKRPRLLDTRSSQYARDDRSPLSAKSPPPPPLSPQARRKATAVGGGGAVEERKRGQRLFGALLGTLSQSNSSSPAHRRRSEIEKKQLGKLRQKEEEVAEEKRRKREELDVKRRKEQKLWEEQGMRLRHGNMQAMAHFLKTEAQPCLYYKPWDLRPEEENQIKQQIEETDARIQRELAEHTAETQHANNGKMGNQNEVHLPRPKSPHHVIVGRHAEVEQPDSSADVRKREEEAEQDGNSDMRSRKKKKQSDNLLVGSDNGTAANKSKTANQPSPTRENDNHGTNEKITANAPTNKNDAPRPLPLTTTTKTTTTATTSKVTHGLAERRAADPGDMHMMGHDDEQQDDDDEDEEMGKPSSDDHSRDEELVEGQEDDVIY